MSMGCFGCRSFAVPTMRPYQATPASTSLLWAAYNHTMRPPQQKPVMASLSVLPPPDFFAQATVASRSSITCLSGTFETTLLMISWMSVSFETSPWRA